jgi:hypothetical protein
MIDEQKVEQEAEKANGYGYPNFYGQKHEAFNDGFKAGVHFAELELSKPKVFEIDFAGSFKAKFEINNGEINIIAAVDGWGHAIDPDQIIITQVEK